MSNGPQQSTLLEKLQSKATAQMDESQERQQSALKSFETQWNAQLQRALRQTVSDTESLHAAAKSMCDQAKRQMETDLADLQASTTRTGRALSFTLWKTAMLSGFSLTLGAIAAALGGFVVFGMMSLEAKALAVPPAPLALNESRVMRGVGGLGTVIVLPAQIETTICPIGAPRGRICIKKH